MAAIDITLPDGSVRALDAGSTCYDLAKQLGRRLAEDALAAEIDGKLCDLSHALTAPASARIITFDSPEGCEIFWHSSAHLMAEAVTRLFPGTKYTIGPAIENGFYYDFDSEHGFTPEDLALIEAEMAKIAGAKAAFVRSEVSREEALRLFEERGNPYKTEIIGALPDDAVISLYRQGEFVDLCRGPHVPTTACLKAVKLLSLAGAYWRGDHRNRMLQRIYGISFPAKKMLDEWVARFEEAKKRDHRKIGREMDLFSFQEEGPGFPFWHPNGTIIFNALVDYIRAQNTKRGYGEVRTPPILNAALWHKSGHWDNYHENMYFTAIDDEEYAIKPMNCPGGLLIYKTGLHSYRELPLKNAELGLVHRHELSGVLHGLFRVRSFTQDDAHIFCEPAQIREQVLETIRYTIEVYRDFGFEDIAIFIATRPEKSMGSDEDWDLATDALTDAMTDSGMGYRLKKGEGAFYGPKIEFNIKDSLGRNWQCGTIQVDFSMPARLGIAYRGRDGKDHVPVMIHRAIFGSLERFIGIITEHFAGKFPLWIAPVQAIVLSVSEASVSWADTFAARLLLEGIRAERDFSGESLGNKIRLARNRRIPYIFIIGDKESESSAVSWKTYFGDNGGGAQADQVISALRQAVQNRSLNLLNI
ncbi:MAG: threonine--tRNA ligase [Spirochaetota bacterium]|nr:threonine--tRNA ligase [Spirochaetota bacterium]